MSPERKETTINRDEVQSKRMLQLNTPSWGNVEQMLSIRTQHKPRLQSLLISNLDELRDYYNLVYQATINGIKPPKPDLNNGHNRILAPHTRRIREMVTGKIEKYSYGYRKSVRREKAFARRGTIVK